MAKSDCKLEKVKSPLGSFLITKLTQKLQKLQTPSKNIIFDLSFTSIPMVINLTKYHYLLIYYNLMIIK